jgi:hypothetical protein
MITYPSLSEFKSQMSDFARPNRFEVLINPPSLYKFNDNEFFKTIWTAQTATIPQRTQGKITLKYHGMELVLPGDYAKEDLVVTFINDYEWETRSFFERWMEDNIQQVAQVNNRNYAYDLIADSSMTVNQLGRTNESLASYNFYDVFPTVVGPIELAMANADQLETYTVTFAYSYWVNNNLITPTQG